jgi:ferredoxin
MGKYAITVDRDACVGDRNCSEEAPETFEIDKEGKVFIKDPAGDPPKYVLSAARNCPLEVITLHDADTGEKVWPED